MICSYCKVVMGTKHCDYNVKPGMEISHGLCEKCAEAENKKIDDKIKAQENKDGN